MYSAVLSDFRTLYTYRFGTSSEPAQSRDKKSSRITSFNGLAVLSYLAGKEGRLPGTRKKDVISRMIKRFDKDSRDGKNEQDEGELYDMYARGDRGGGETSGERFD